MMTIANNINMLRSIKEFVIISDASNDVILGSILDSKKNALFLTVRMKRGWQINKLVTA